MKAAKSYAKPIHVPRRSERKRRPVPTPAREYTRGHFLELVEKHNFPPGFQPSAVTADARSVPVLLREEDFARARGGWGAGTMDMPRTPVNQIAPGWL